MCHTRRQWETRNFMSRSSVSRAGESCSEARGNISFGGPVGPENTSEGGGGGLPLEIGQIRSSFYTSVHSTCTFKLHTTV